MAVSCEKGYIGQACEASESSCSSCVSRLTIVLENVVDQSYFVMRMACFALFKAILISLCISAFSLYFAFVA